MPKGDKKTKQDVQIEKQILGIAKELADAIKQQSQNQAEVVRSKKVERDVAKEALNDILEIASLEGDRTTQLREQDDIAKDLAKNKAELNALEREHATLKDSTNQTERDIADLLDKEIAKRRNKRKHLEDEFDQAEKIKKEIGGTLEGLDAISKIPILGSMMDAEGAAKKMADAMKDGASAEDAMALGFEHMSKAFNQAFFLGTILAIGNALMEANKSVTALNKEFGISRDRALEMRKGMAATARDADHLRVTTSKLLEANMSLTEQFQVSAELNHETLGYMTRMTEAGILTNEAAGRTAASAALHGKSMEEVMAAQEDIVNATNEELGTNIKLKTVLEASAKVGGQIRAQMGGNLEAITKAVQKAKAFGFELEQIAGAGKQLLDFESSIEAELEAELLTGKQLNLERARLAALTGDYETLTEEIVANVGDFTDFSNMNVLQQQAIAKSVGMTADELSNALFAEADRAALMEEAVANNDKQTIQMLEQMDTQEKFNLAIEQLKELLVDLMTFLEPVFNLFGGIAEFLGTSVGKAILFGAAIGKMVSVAIQLRKASIGKSIADIFGSFAKIPFGLGIPLAFATVAGLGALIVNMSKKGDDVIARGSGASGYGDNTLITKNQGAIQLNNKDTIVAGTNLGVNQGDDIVKRPEGAVKTNTPMNITVQSPFDSFGSTNPVAINGVVARNTKFKTQFS